MLRRTTAPARNTSSSSSATASASTRRISSSASRQPPSSSACWQETSWTTTRRPTWSSWSGGTPSKSPAGHWAECSLVEGESLVYWLKKLVFRGAWLDHRVKEGKLEVGWDDDAAEFSYRDTPGGGAL